MPNRRAPVPLGDRFGKLTVVGSETASRGRTLWLCRCDCGKEKTFQPSHLRASSTVSCGCAPKHGRLTHGQSRSLTYKSWSAMKSRCSDPRAAKYALYGGRGIRVCAAWQSFEGFLADMGERPSSSHSLDRIDGAGHYQLGNCRWATHTEQSRNRSNVRKFGGLTLPEIAALQGRPYHQVRAELVR